MAATTSAPVLIVDDDVALRAQLEQSLRDAGYEVLAAGECAQGLRLLRSAGPQVVLVDWQLPTGCAAAFIREAADASPRTSIIVLTDTADLERALDAVRGAAHFLEKPVRPQHLLSLVRKEYETARLLGDLEAARAGLRARNAELEEVNERLRGIVASSRRLALCTRARQLGRLALVEFARNTGASGGSLYLRRGSALHLVHALDPGHAPNVLRFPLPPGSVFGRAFGAGEALLIEDIARKRGIAGSGRSGYASGSCLVFPFRASRGPVVGILSLHDKAEGPFTSLDRELGSLLASFVGEALRTLQANEALLASERRLRRVAAHLQQGLLILDRGRIVFANPRAAEVLGRTPEETLGASALDVVAPEDRDLVARFIADARRSPEESNEVAFSVLGRNQSRRRVHARFALSGPDGDAVGGFVILNEAPPLLGPPDQASC